MSLPACPMCGHPHVRRIDSAAVIKLGKPGSPLRLSVTTLRSYRCPCGVEYRTSETIDTINPETCWLSKFAEDVTKNPPTG